MKRTFHWAVLGLVLATQANLLCRAVSAQTTVSAQIKQDATAAKRREKPVALFWLEPVKAGTVEHLPWPAQPPYRMLQKNKMFSPHLLVIPVGATVSFPNEDPFFHNVFSLFDGKRFDLGLYEAGSSRDIRFERSGISYLFCNIHPEMSAVIVALRTPLWAKAGPDGLIRIANVPPGEYQAHLWLEGEDESALSAWTHRVTVSSRGTVDAGSFIAKANGPQPHRNLFGKPYKSESSPY